MNRMILVRHGETEWNEGIRYQGQRDIPLSERGRQQARRVAERLKGEKLAAIYSSDLRRAYETANVIADPHSIYVVPLMGLRETSFGEWEGMTYKEIASKYPDLVGRWVADPEFVSPPGGESFSQMRERVMMEVERITRAHEGDTVVVVSHGGVIRGVICTILGLPLKTFWRLKIDNASISVVEFYQDGNAILCSMNDVSHLGDPAEGLRGQDRVFER